MKVSKRGFEWECGYGQHVLDKHDKNIKQVAIDNRQALYKYSHETRRTQYILFFFLI